jgi:hypothetical protein
MSKPERISYIEWHDARAQMICVRPNGQVHIEYEHIAAYDHVSNCDASIWSYKATMEWRGVEGLVIDGPIREHDCVVSGAAKGEDGRQIDLVECLRGFPRCTVEIQFSGGCRIRLAAEGGQLKLFGDPEFLETFVASEE